MEKTIYEQARQKALAIYEKAHIVLTSQEKANLEVADFGLNDLERTGLEIITYVNTERCCAKEWYSFRDKPVLNIVMHQLREPPTSERRKPFVSGLVRAIFM